MIRWNDKPVYLCCGYTDMRKSINGLMILVQESFSLDPFTDALFVFCNRSRNRIKILEMVPIKAAQTIVMKIMRFDSLNCSFNHAYYSKEKVYFFST
jgi:transposase